MKRTKIKDVILLSREETRDFLKTSFPTLRRWTAQGLLNCYQLGGRVYYKKHEILEALEHIN